MNWVPILNLVLRYRYLWLSGFIKSRCTYFCSIDLDPLNFYCQNMKYSGLSVPKWKNKIKEGDSYPNPSITFIFFPCKWPYDRLVASLSTRCLKRVLEKTVLPKSRNHLLFATEILSRPCVGYSRPRRQRSLESKRPALLRVLVSALLIKLLER